MEYPKRIPSTGQSTTWGLVEHPYALSHIEEELLLIMLQKEHHA